MGQLDRCKAGELWDPFFKKCRNVVCGEKGKVWVGGKCYNEGEVPVTTTTTSTTVTTTVTTTTASTASTTALVASTTEKVKEIDNATAALPVPGIIFPADEEENGVLIPVEDAQDKMPDVPLDGAQIDAPENATDGAQVNVPDTAIDGAQVNVHDTPIDGAQVNVSETPIDDAQVNTPDTPIDGAQVNVPDTPSDGTQVNVAKNPPEESTSTDQEIQEMLLDFITTLASAPSTTIPSLLSPIITSTREDVELITRRTSTFSSTLSTTAATATPELSSNSTVEERPKSSLETCLKFALNSEEFVLNTPAHTIFIPQYQVLKRLWKP